MIAINVWKLFPFVAVMVLAGLQAVPNDLYEAARVDGAHASRTRSATSCCRALRPVLVAVTLLLVIWGLNADHHHLHDHARRPGQPDADHADPDLPPRLRGVQLNQAAALSVMFFAVTIVVVSIYIRVVGAADDGARVMKHGRARPAIVGSARALLIAVCLFPFVWMALSSIKTLRELYTVPPIWLPEVPTLENYRKVLFDLEHAALLPQQRRSSRSASTALALSLRSSRPTASPASLPRQARLQAFVLVGQLLPTAAIIVPLFITLRVLGLVNTYLGLILVYMILTLPLSVWMLTSYFRAIPVELEEAAIIDGASRLGVLFRITLPLSLPGVVAVVVYAFVTTWNEFIFALVLRQDSRVKTLPIGIAEFTTEFNTDWGAVMAASVVMTLPIAILFLRCSGSSSAA